MTVNEYMDICRSSLKVLSAYNGRVLCASFDPTKHTAIGERKIISVWSDVKLVRGNFGQYTTPIMCCYVDGYKEYMEEQYAKATKEEE